MDILCPFLFENFHSGFRALHSTETALVKVTKDLLKLSSTACFCPVFLLSPKPVIADGHPALSLVLLEISSCKKGVFSLLTVTKALAPRGSYNCLVFSFFLSVIIYLYYIHTVQYKEPWGKCCCDLALYK